ncbi:NAD(P)-dependent oxidoreductase [Aeromicrobium terrae]|uniref:Hydroxyacid dehydrogenase n=1 Tax=Aeromicrobium terrae TaxID=2498846 RepID=A0A5C8NEC4_9ACTN|nr:NAD(P)-dependent oxidoreductase [Aeromicrobium terrae]TXL57361.1 hydroxyacid dehydrogenase [Aeromicrobium terrae]
MRISVPNQHMQERLADLDVIVWDWDAPPPDGPPLDLAVRPYVLSGGFEHLDAERVRVVQTQSLGYDDAIGNVPEGIVWCNAVGVHEGPTAEIAMALVLASQRGVDENARAMPDGRWERHWHPGLLGARVLLLGYGGIGTELESRLSGFGVEIVRVARTAREGIHGTDELPDLLPDADVVVVAVPYGPATHHLVDDVFLSAMRDGALLVNVARGKVADTEAIVRHTASGHVRFAADVLDPEPLPADHPLWTTPGVLITPHVGGAVTTMHDRVEAMVREQVRRLQVGEPLMNVVDVSG